jgi:hypothetical protein
MVLAMRSKIRLSPTPMLGPEMHSTHYDGASDGEYKGVLSDDL